MVTCQMSTSSRQVKVETPILIPSDSNSFGLCTPLQRALFNEHFVNMNFTNIAQTAFDQ